MNSYLKTMRLFIFFVAFFCIGCQGNNFSDAALEEFFVLDKCIAESNDAIGYTIEMLVGEIAEFTHQKSQYEPFLDKADQVHRITKKFQEYIDKIRVQLVVESGGFYTKEEAEKQGNIRLEGRPINVRNTDTPYRIFIVGEKGKKEPQGAVIQQEMLKLKNACIQLVESLWDNGGIKGTVFGNLKRKTAAIEELKNELAFMEIDSYNPKAFENKTWAEVTFENMPVAAIYPTLRKLQNEAKMAELAVVRFLAAQQQTNCFFGGDAFEVLALSTKPKVLLGENYEAEIVFGRYNSTAVFSVFIDNQSIESVNGKVIYKSKPTSIGTKKYTAKITLTNPITGETETFSKDFHYEVSP